MHLTFGVKYNQPTLCLPSSIVYLAFGDKYNQPIILPPRIARFHLNNKVYEQYKDQLMHNRYLTYTNICDYRIMKHTKINKHNLERKTISLTTYCISMM